MSKEGKFTTGTFTTEQIDMFTDDIENGDSNDGVWYYGHQYTTKYNIDDDICIPTDHNYTISYGSVHTANYITDEAESKTREIKHHAKAFRKDVESFLIDIKRVSPAGSASFELAKDFMDKHYGEESK